MMWGMAANVAAWAVKRSGRVTAGSSPAAAALLLPWVAALASADRASFGWNSVWPQCRCRAQGTPRPSLIAWKAPDATCSSARALLPMPMLWCRSNLAAEGARARMTASNALPRLSNEK
jgi:hypothetical protein